MKRREGKGGSKSGWGNSINLNVSAYLLAFHWLERQGILENNDTIVLGSVHFVMNRTCKRQEVSRTNSWSILKVQKSVYHESVIEPSQGWW